jgi:hypothetical protein
MQNHKEEFMKDRISIFFKTTAESPDGVSTFRLYLMRLLYLLNFVMLGLSAWPVIINHAGAWDPVKGVAFSFWAVLSALSGLGLRYPLKMLPLLLLQLLYKSVWVIAVALPLWSTFRSIELTNIMAMGAVVDIIVIPWPYVLANYVKKRGDRWK